MHLLDLRPLVTLTGQNDTSASLGIGRSEPLNQKKKALGHKKPQSAAGLTGKRVSWLRFKAVIPQSSINFGLTVSGRW